MTRWLHETSNRSRYLSTIGNVRGKRRTDDFAYLQLLPTAQQDELLGTCSGRFTVKVCTCLIAALNRAQTRK